MHGEIMLQDQRAKVALTWAMVEKLRSGFIDMWLVYKNKGGNYVVISLVVPYVMASTNLAFNELLKMTKLVR